MGLATVSDPPVFYMTVNSNRNEIHDLVSDPEPIPAMRNVIQFQNKDSIGTRNLYSDKYVLDSGGYSAMKKFGGEFPWTVKEYHHWARDQYRKQEFDWVATMDLACEPAFDEVLSVEERITRTVENTIQLLSYDPDYPVLPVLQGRKIEQWLDCYDRLTDHGITPSYAGIGTLCRLKSPQKIREIERAIRVQTDIDSFHGFGVKVSAFQQGAEFESADSNAWTWPVSYGLKTKLQGGKLVRTPITDDDRPHHQSFQSYYNHASSLQEKAYPTDAGELTSVDEW